MEGRNEPLTHKPFETLKDWRPRVSGGSGTSEKPADIKTPGVFMFPVEVVTEYVEKSKDQEKAKARVENLEKTINKEILGLRKKGKDIFSDDYAYDYLESNKNSPLADILCDYWEKQKKEKEPVSGEQKPKIPIEESGTDSKKETPPDKNMATGEIKESKTEITIADIKSKEKPVIKEKPEENIPIETLEQKETEKEKRNADIEKIGKNIEKQLNDRENNFEKLEVGTTYINPEGGWIRITGVFPEDYIVSIDIRENKRRVNKEFSFRDFRSYLEKNKFIREIRNKTETARGVEIDKNKKEIREERNEINKEVIKTPEAVKEVVGKEGISEKKRVKKEITEEKLKEELENISNTRKDLLDYLDSFDVLTVKIKNEYGKGLVNDWLFNSPFFDGLRKYLKGEINKLDDGYWRDIPWVIRNKVKDIFAIEKKRGDSGEKIEGGKEKSAEEQLFEQDMKTLQDIALRMALELDSRLKEEDAEFKNKNEKDRNAFLQGALRGFLQKAMKRYELPPEETKEKISQIIERIISS